jgi:NitT/TauT family transport system permease protein/taurine transport system permease protein
LLLVLILAWQFASTVWLPSIDPHMVVLMPAPTTIARTAAGLVASGELFFHLVASLKREAWAFLFACHRHPSGDRDGVVAARLQSSQSHHGDPASNSAAGMDPSQHSLVRYRDAQNQFIIFLGMFFPILINTIVGVKNVDPNLVRAARSLGAPEYKVLSRIILKGSLPQIITGRSHRTGSRLDGARRG